MQRAGLYVSGSRGSRLSNLLMQAIPAKVAQVLQIVMVTPGNGDYKDRSRSVGGGPGGGHRRNLSFGQCEGDRGSGLNGTRSIA